MSRRRRWSDIQIEDPDPGVFVQSSLLVLWNVVMSPETLEVAWRCKSGTRVKDALALSDDLPGEVLHAEYVDARFVGVPLVPGISPENRVFECFGITLLLIKHTEASGDVIMCQPSQTVVQRGCCKTMVMRVAGKRPTDFSGLPRNAALALWELNRGSFAEVYMKALVRAAKLHETYVRNFAVKRNIPVKVFKMEALTRCAITRENLERLRLTATAAWPMGLCPIQLGWSQVSEWTCSHDVCRRLPKKKKEFVDSLAHRCSAGQISSQVLNKRSANPSLPSVRMDGNDSSYVERADVAELFVCRICQCTSWHGRHV